MRLTVPDSWPPELDTELVTTTAMYEGTSETGGGLFPVVDVQPAPQLGGAIESWLAKPLKAGDAGPLLSGLRLDQSLATR